MAETKTKLTVNKTATPKAAASKKATSATKNARVTKSATVVCDQKRHEMIQHAAYFIAERHNFAGDPHTFWSAAEAQINNLSM